MALISSRCCCGYYLTTSWCSCGAVALPCHANLPSANVSPSAQRSRHERGDAGAPNDAAARRARARVRVPSPKAGLSRRYRDAGAGPARGGRARVRRDAESPVPLPSLQFSASLRIPLSPPLASNALSHAHIPRNRSGGPRLNYSMAGTEPWHGRSLMKEPLGQPAPPHGSPAVRVGCRRAAKGRATAQAPAVRGQGTRMPPPTATRSHEHRSHGRGHGFDSMARAAHSSMPEWMTGASGTLGGRCISASLALRMMASPWPKVM